MPFFFQSLKIEERERERQTLEVCSRDRYSIYATVCSKEKSQEVKSHKSKKENPFSPGIIPLPPKQYCTSPPPLLIRSASNILALKRVSLIEIGLIGWAY
jgi:hypothetical protein